MKTKATEKLGAILSGGIDVHRCAAAQALGAIEAPNAVPVLVKALLDEDPDVRVDAAAALKAFNDPSIAEPIMENLVGDPEADVKVEAIRVLTNLRHTPVLPLLKKLAVSRSEEDVAWDEEAFYADSWDGWTDVQLEAIKALGQFGEGVEAVVEALSDEFSDDIDESCYSALAQMGEAGAEALADGYVNAGERGRRRIAKAVAKAEGGYCNGLLEAMLKDPLALIRTTALKGVPVGSAVLAPLFGDADAAVRAAAVAHAGAQHAPLLWDLMADDSADVRYQVFKVIAANPTEFNDKDLVKALKKAIAGEPKAATQAAVALVALTGAKAAKGLMHVFDKPDIPKDFRLGVIKALQAAGEVSAPALLKAAGDEDRDLRLASLTALAHLAANSESWPNEAGAGLLAALDGELILPPEPEEEVEPEPITEEIAAEIDEELPLKPEPVVSTLDAIIANKPDIPAEAPAEIVLSEDEERLVNLAHSHRFTKRKIDLKTAAAPHVDIKRYAARLLADVPHEDATNRLIEALSREDAGEFGDEVLFALAEHGAQKGSLPETAAEPLQALLDSVNSETRVLAVRAYGFLEDDFVDATLEALLEHKDELVRAEAVKALARRGIVEASSLRDPYLGVAIATARALAALKGDAAVDDLVMFAMANDGTYRRDIGKLLGQYAPAAGAKALLAVLENDTLKAKWLVAIDALSELFQTPEPEATLKAA